MKYFNNCKSLDNLKKEYKSLAMKNHPDMGGSTTEMALINAEFSLAFRTFSIENKKSAEYIRAFYTEKGWQGSRYSSNNTLADIAKIIKAYVKDVYPTWKFSVRTEYFSGGCSLNVSITEVPYQILDDEKLEKYAHGNHSIWGHETSEQIIAHYRDVFDNRKELQNINTEILKDSAANVVNDVKALIDSYNYDDSDAMTDYFDVGFYSHLYLGSYTRKNGYWDIVPRTARLTSDKASKAKKICA